MKEIKEKILIKALELQEQGEPLERIYAAFPEEAGELRAFFELAADIRADAEGIKPPPELLRGAMRAAAAAERQSAGFRPAVAGFFGRMPVGARVLAPALAVLLIFFFANASREPVGLPLPLPAPEGLPADQPAASDMAGSPGAETRMMTVPPPRMTDGSSETSVLEQAPPATQPSVPADDAASDARPAQTSQASDTQGLGMAADAGGSPSSLAAQIVEISLDAATEEEAICREELDLEKKLARQQEDQALAAGFSALEESLIDASAAQKAARVKFQAELMAAVTIRRTAVDASALRLQSGCSDNLEAIEEFKAAAGKIEAEFKAALGL